MKITGKCGKPWKAIIWYSRNTQTY
jgi:hypothetical protein